MKIITYTFYKCEICLKEYFEEQDAIKCESFPIADCGFKIGDTVMVKDGSRIGKITNFQVDSDFQHKEHYVSHVHIDDTLAIHVRNIEKHNG